MYNLKWKNKFSGEEGYVAKVKKSAGYFENTFQQEAAKKYKTEQAYNKDIQILNSIGEADNNDFFAIEA